MGCGPGPSSGKGSDARSDQGNRDHMLTSLAKLYAGKKRLANEIKIYEDVQSAAAARLADCKRESEEIDAQMNEILEGEATRIGEHIYREHKSESDIS